MDRVPIPEIFRTEDQSAHTRSVPQSTTPRFLLSVELQTSVFTFPTHKISSYCGLPTLPGIFSGSGLTTSLTGNCKGCSPLEDLPCVETVFNLVWCHTEEHIRLTTRTVHPGRPPGVSFKVGTYVNGRSL